MDGDDILERDALSRLYQLSEEKSLDVLYFDGESFFETEELREEKKNYIAYYAKNRRLFPCNDRGGNAS